MAVADRQVPIGTVVGIDPTLTEVLDALEPGTWAQRQTKTRPWEMYRMP
jgi:hypothetical protein